ncbi:ABC transporter permease [Geotalea sp. SG265]|uniref:ABC transporter permease n=1 Tax=Geotalea sp. SG265 TaxID=2922867 RepID=UPI001FAF63F1|nr:ABC transporter permease [Geotalea sp. SG265]
MQGNRAKGRINRRLNREQEVGEATPVIIPNDPLSYIGSSYHPNNDVRPKENKEKKFKKTGITSIIDFGLLGNIVLKGSFIWFIFSIVTLVVRFFLGMPDYFQSSAFVRYVLCGGVFGVFIGMMIGGVLRLFSSEPKTYGKANDDDDFMPEGADAIATDPKYFFLDCNVFHNDNE